MNLCRITSLRSLLGLGLFAVTMVFLPACGAGSTDAQPATIRSSSVALPTGSAAGESSDGPPLEVAVTTPSAERPPTTPSAEPPPTTLSAEPPAVIAADALFIATAADVSWSQSATPFDPTWSDDELAAYRRSLHIVHRLQVIDTFIKLEAIDLEGSLRVEGMSPPYTRVDDYFADLHNNADRIIVTKKDGTTGRLSDWFAQVDRLSQSVYENLLADADR